MSPLDGSSVEKGKSAEQTIKNSGAREREGKTDKISGKAGSKANRESSSKSSGAFKEYSVAEFFKKNKQMLGFSGKVRSLTTIVHEYVTNSLDACEEAGILPNIRVEVEQISQDRYRVVVADNGPGLPKHLIGKALAKMLTGTKFHRYIQQRGQQGIGAAGATLYAQLTTGKGIHVISGYRGKMISCDVSIDFKANEPKVENLEEQESSFHGLIVEGEFADVKYDASQYGVLEYLKRTAIANPHATIQLIAPNGERHLFERSVNELPRRVREIKPHPLGISAHDLLDIAAITPATKLGSMLTTELSRFSAEKLRRVAELADVDMNKSPKDMTWYDAEKLVKAFKQLKWIAPPTDVLSPIGKEQIEKSLSNILFPEIISVVERSPKVLWGGVPFQVEAAIAFGGKISRKGEIMRFANKAPLLFDAAGCAITQVVKNIDWGRYGLKKFDEEPIVVLVNVVSTHIPYVSAGKQAISSESELTDEIKNAIQEAARGIKLHLVHKRKAAELAKKKKAFLRYVGQIAADLSALSGASKEEIEERIKYIIEHRFDMGKGRERTEAELASVEDANERKGAVSEGSDDSKGKKGEIATDTRNTTDVAEGM